MTLEKIHREKNQTVSEYVYDVLKKNIINLNIKPGDKISEVEISKLLDMSRTPVREAFIKLAKEGVLYILPQRGTFISKINLEQVEEARFIRGSLETAVMRIAVEGLDEPYLLEIQKSLERQKGYIENKQYESFLEEDERFHQMIFEACGKRRSWDVIDQVNTQYKRVRLLSFELSQNLETVFEQHKTIFRAILEKDLALAEETVTKHVEKILTDQIYLQKRYPQYFESEEDTAS